MCLTSAKCGASCHPKCLLELSGDTNTDRNGSRAPYLATQKQECSDDTGSNSSWSLLSSKEKDASLSWKTGERLESSPFATSELRPFGEMLVFPGPELEECFCPAEVSSGSVEEVEAVGRRSDVDVDGCGSSKHV